ncbi:MAG TPA: hypothetical protein VLE27_10400 [Thermoanaerobaculia bacterium]|nr:hypothetical protein [Thermoanaerobaculia bacterium]
MQKKVGFEFETGDIHTRMSSWTDWQWRPHPKNSLLYSGDGFEIRTDEYRGHSQLELILKEIDEKNPREVAKLLDQVIPKAISAVEAIASACKGKKDWVGISDIPAVRGWGGWAWNRTTQFRWKGGGNSISGQLQATAGIGLSRLANILTGDEARLLKKKYKDREDEGEHYRDAYINLSMLLASYGAVPLMQDALAVVSQKLTGLKASEEKELAAVVTMIATVPFTAYRRESPLPYPKAAASPFLARTDLATVVAQLPKSVRHVLTGKLLKKLVLLTINRGLEGFVTVGEDDPVFPEDTFWEKDSKVPRLDALKIGKWVERLVPTSLKPAKDRLTKAHFPGDTQTRAWLESIGEFGSKTDPGNLPIFELRNLMQSTYLEDLAMNARFVIEFLNPKLRSRLMERTDPSYRGTVATPVLWNPWTLHRAFFLLPFPLG